MTFRSANIVVDETLTAGTGITTPWLELSIAEDSSPEEGAFLYVDAAGALHLKVDGSDTPFGSGGGVDGSGTENYLAKWDDSGGLTDSPIVDQTNRIEINKQIYHQILVAPNVAALSQHIMQGSDHIGEAVALVGYVNTMTCDCTDSGSSVIGVQAQAAATRSAGTHTVTNIAVQGEAYTGTGVGEAYSWFSQNGFMRNDGGVQLATTAGTGVTIGSGTTAASDTVQINKALTVANSNAVTLGDTVRSFVIPGSTSLNPNIRIGRTASSTSLQLSTKNTVAANASCGIEVALDTTINAGARGGLFLYRGANGGYASGNSAGVVLAAATGFPFTGSAANDLTIYNQLGGRIVLGADNSTFTPAMTIAAGSTNAIAMLGAVTVTAANGIAWGSGGPKILSGSASPESSVTAPVGSLYLRTGGGAGTTLYVKESGSGNTGWIAMVSA